MSCVSESGLRSKIGTRDAFDVDMHANQLAVPFATVRNLVDEQFSQWRRLLVREVPSQGTVNALFRVGDKLLARFPLEPGDVGATRRRLQSEAQAARELLGRTRFSTPEPVALGEPGAGYPLPWSVQTWLPGTVATEEDPAESIAFAHDLAEFIPGVRAIDTRGNAFSGRGRGGELRSHDAWMETCLERSEHLLDVPRLRRTWAVMRVLPRTAPDVIAPSRRAVTQHLPREWAIPPDTKQYRLTVVIVPRQEHCLMVPSLD